MSIAKFPAWTPIDEAARPFIDTMSNIYKISDYTFSNLYLWDIDGRGRVSLLNDNLAFMISDYITGDIFYTFIGENNPLATACRLLDYAHCESGVDTLYIVPEAAVCGINGKQGITVREDPDNHDYILDLPKLAARSGTSLMNLRGSYNKFLNAHKDTLEILPMDVYDSKHQAQILSVFTARQSLKINSQLENELEVMRRLFRADVRFELTCYGLKAENKLVAFIMVEPLQGGEAVAHFWKANTNYKGAYSYLISEVAALLAQEGIFELNFEQDLGLEGLRRAKHLLRPSRVLKKYTVQKSYN